MKNKKQKGEWQMNRKPLRREMRSSVGVRKDLIYNLGLRFNCELFEIRACCKISLKLRIPKNNEPLKIRNNNN